jgi:hypothetical protein
MVEKLILDVAFNTLAGAFVNWTILNVVMRTVRMLAMNDVMEFAAYSFGLMGETKHIKKTLIAEQRRPVTRNSVKATMCRIEQEFELGFGELHTGSGSWVTSCITT